MAVSKRKKKTTKARVSKRAVKQFTELFPSKKKQPKAVRNADYLSLLGRTKNKRKREQLIALADKDQIDAISEIIENILRGTLVLTEIQQKRLRRYKNCMRQVVIRKTPLHKKKAYLQTYSGGFIPTLLQIGVPVVIDLARKLFGL